MRISSILALALLVSTTPLCAQAPNKSESLMKIATSEYAGAARVVLISRKSRYRRSSTATGLSVMSRSLKRAR